MAANLFNSPYGAPYGLFASYVYDFTKNATIIPALLWVNFSAATFKLFAVKPNSQLPKRLSQSDSPRPISISIKNVSDIISITIAKFFVLKLISEKSHELLNMTQYYEKALYKGSVV